MIFNLSLDDQSPHPRAGLNFESVGWCNKLIKQYPAIKINLFVPGAYRRLGEQPYCLSDYPDWVSKMNDLPKKNYSINMHGYYHSRIDGKNPNSNNDEWQFLDEGQAFKRINKMIGEFNKAGLKYKNVFRAPGWKISLGSIKALQNNGFVIAGDKKYYDIHREHIKGVRWISYSWDLNSPCNIKNGNVLAYGHTSDWCSNYFCEKTYYYVLELLKQREFKFKFLEEL